jgi:Holliday junction resolvase RusA-like endonuclease
MSNARNQHWRAVWAQRAKCKALIKEQVRFLEKPKTPLTRCRIIFARYSSRVSDFDNRVHSFKGILDGLVEAGILIDDNDEVIIDRAYPAYKASPKFGHIEIIIEEV